MDDVMGAFMQNRLRFNALMRLLFVELVIDVNRPGMNWKKGMRKGEVPVYYPVLKKFAFAPDFATYGQRNQIELPEALKNAERY